ncbi:MAG: NAD(P)H-quinone oxidoreductase [Proteobacteria bacterium]|jgi:putative PIG3 family NAD(P)H quinone oxidoreductase|nr:NAD(P)H-quinone oxidoreductase [Pseudomonadota bacterium]MDA1301537.1 NAD(P)H-quinone oxidoreductase [Pseudomonadota bacterium]
MKAIIVESDQSLTWSSRERPSPGDHEVLIEVYATAINRADLMQRRGFYPPPAGASEVMGLECAGVVAGTGSSVSRWKEGDRVCALLAGGGYGEFATVDEGSVLPIPDSLDFVGAAALPEVFATAWLNLFMEAGLKPGERVLLHAGASGVGTAAVQLCRSFNNPSFVTAGTAEKINACIDLGAAGGGIRHSDALWDEVRAFSGKQGIDVILDPVGAGYLADNIGVLAMNGRLVLIGLMGGARGEIDLSMLMGKRARIIGSTLRARPVAEKAAIIGQLYEKVWPKLGSGEIRPVIDTTFPIEDAGAAHERVASDETIGKVVLLVKS